MSISLSIYDVFANLLPGLLYLFAINEFLKSVSFKGLDPTVLPGASATIGILFIGYLLGHLFNALTYNGWYMLFYRDSSNHDRNNMKSDAGRALASLRAQYPDLDFGTFLPRDTDVLFNAIQVNNKELADRIEITRVTAIMMRNVSFGIFILGMVEIINTVRASSLIYLLVTLACLIASRLALSQTAKYYHWFFKDVFRIGSLYGKSLTEVVSNLRGEANPKPSKSKRN
ncbi:MAG: hypothetical protein ABI986_07155 [Chloroflexota bacterium]